MDKKEILDKLKSSKATKKMRPQLEDILISAYVKSDFSTTDSTATDDKETAEAKELEIKTFDIPHPVNEYQRKTPASGPIKANYLRSRSKPRIELIA